jgi:hypothetical protein
MVALSIGVWGGTSSANRDCFAFELRVEDRPGFMLRDAAASPFASHEDLLGRMASREEALQSPLKQEAFDILDAIGGQDPRLNGWWLDSRSH